MRTPGVVSPAGMVGVLVLDRTVPAGVYIDFAVFTLQKPGVEALPFPPWELARLATRLDRNPASAFHDTTIHAVPIADAVRIIGELVGLPGTIELSDLAERTTRTLHEAIADRGYFGGHTSEWNYDFAKIAPGGP